MAMILLAEPMSSSHPPATSKLEVWFQYKGNVASLMQTAGPHDRIALEQALLTSLEGHLQQLQLTLAKPNSTKIIWGSGQIRCFWVLRKSSTLRLRMIDQFNAAAITIKNCCPAPTISMVWFKEDGKQLYRVKVKQYNVSAVPHESVVASRVTQTGLKTSSGVDHNTMNTSGATEIRQGRVEISSSSKRKREDPPPASDAYQQRKRTHKGHDIASLSTPLSRVPPRRSTKSPHPFPIPNFILLPPLTDTLPEAPHPIATPHTMYNSGYSLSDMQGHRYRLELGGVHTTLLRTVQTRLAQTRWQLNEEREERMRLERQMHALTMPPEPSPSMSSMSMSVSSGSASTLMDYEDVMWDGEGEKKADDSVPETRDSERHFELALENERLSAEVQRLHERLSEERAAREAMQQSLEDEWKLRKQIEQSFGPLNGISPTSVPYILEAFARLAQLTDKAMALDEP